MLDPWAEANAKRDTNAPMQTTQPVAVVPEPAKLDEPIPEDLKVQLKANGLAETPDGILQLWQKSQMTLALAKANEMEIRKTAVKVWVPKPTEGTNNVPLGNGYVLKAVIKYNYKLADNKTVENCLDRIAKIGNEGAFIADRLVSWTPNFLITEYRALQEQSESGNETAKQILKVVGEMLTITDAAPTLDIKEPKAKK